MPKKKKRFIINEDAMKADGDSKETIKFMKDETKKLMKYLDKHPEHRGQ